jgi:hypothetical protein
MYRTTKREMMAVQWTGDNDLDIQIWVGTTHEGKDGFVRMSPTVAKLYVAANGLWINLPVGEWILRDHLGFYPCADVVFRKNYEEFDAVVPASVVAEGVVQMKHNEALEWVKRNVAKESWPTLAGLLLGNAITNGIDRARNK